MGTDIRLHIITQSHADESGEEFWVEAVDGAGFFLARDYDLFCELGGVRCKPGVSRKDHWNRGVPKCVPSSVVESHSLEGAEAATWLRADEFASVATKHTNSEEYWGWRMLSDIAVRLADSLGQDRVRIVVSFDS